jgi:hypothetical protein
MSNQIVISSGAKLRNLNGVITGTTGVLDSVPLGGANGVATLDSSGKVPVSQLPSSVVTYLGTWNAATNTPTLVNGTGDAGDMYLCNVAGTVNFGAGPITFAVGDWVLYGSGTWQKSNGQNGTITSVAVTESGDALTITGSPITTAGTINIGFAGTSAQYVAGDGSLITFPSIITEAQNLITEVYNETGATLTKGTIVYINGGHGNLPTITKAIATSDATSAQTYGIVRTDITNNNNGYVVVIGRLTNLDTQAYSTGAQLYLSSTTAGAWTTTKQYAPNHLVYVGIVVRSHPTQGVVEVKIQNGYELDELHNVSAQTPSNNQGIFYNSSTSLWENKSIATALGYTPANPASVVPYTGATALVNLGTYNLKSNSLYAEGDGAFAGGGLLIKQYASGTTSISGYNTISSQTSAFFFSASQGGSYKNFLLDPSGLTNATTRSYTLPDASGTLALTSNLSSYVPYSGATTDVLLGSWALFSAGVQVTNGGLGVISTDGWLSASKGIFLTDTASGGNWSTGITNITARTSGLLITHNAGGGILNFNTSTTYTYNFPAADGTVALTSNLSSYLPLSGGTLTGALNGTSATFSSSVSANEITSTSSSDGFFNGDRNAVGYANGLRLRTSGANKWLIGSAGNEDLLFYSYSLGSAPMRITSGGNVGIGTSSPSAKLEVSGGSILTNSSFVVRSGSYTLETGITGSGSYIQSYVTSGVGSADLYFYTGTSEKMRITSGGNFDYGGYNIQSSNNATYRQAFYGGIAIMWRGGEDAYIDSNHTYSSSNTNVASYGSSNGIGRLEFGGGNLTWYTYNGGVSAGSAYALTQVFNISKAGLINSVPTYNNTSGGAASVGISAIGEFYRSTSSLKYKKNVKNYTKGLTEVMQMRPVTYNSINEREDGILYAGLIAEEVHDLGLTEFVQYAEDGTPDALAYQNMVAILIKGIQEQQAQIEELKAKIK